LPPTADEEQATLVNKPQAEIAQLIILARRDAPAQIYGLGPRSALLAERARPGKYVSLQRIPLGDPDC
jgi:hypothetical protein